VTAQYLHWYHSGVSIPRPPGDPEGPMQFYGLFGLHWSLLRRKLELDVRAATDLVRIELVSRGDTELHHALMGLLERNFAPRAPQELREPLRDLGDLLAIHRRAAYRKLAGRLYRLAGLD
jgi:hypothetical protein